MNPDTQQPASQQQAPVSKKKVVFIILTIIGLIAVAAGTTMIIRSFQKASDQSSQTTEELTTQAKSHYDQANSLMQQGKLEEAKNAYVEAQDIYKKTNDMSQVEHINASLDLIEKQSVAPKAPTTPPAASQPAN